MKRNNKGRRLLITAVLSAAGVLLMLYPFAKNWIYEYQEARHQEFYQENAQEKDDRETEQALADAAAYNARLAEGGAVLTDPFGTQLLLNGGEEEQSAPSDYDQLLNPFGNGLMGYLEIPKISVKLPIYHGTSSAVLEKGAGHLYHTSLPIGGNGTHSVLSAHTGYSDKRLFTDLELLEEEDEFYLYIMDSKLAYRVDQILIVNPEDTEALRIVPDKDYVTLLTCTPRSINSHRLLVRGTRIPWEERNAGDTEGVEQSTWLRGYKLMIGGCSLLLLGVLLWKGTAGWRRRKRKRKKQKNIS